MGYRALNSDDLVEEIVPLGQRDISVLRPRDTDALLDETVFEERDEFIPYWADLWPSAIVLARHIASRALRGARVLELGCGLGLPSLAVALAGGRATATDWAPEALDAVAANAARNELLVETLVADWRSPEPLLETGPYDLVIAADVLYERRNVRVLTDLLTTLDTETWLADPGRPPAAELVSNLELAGWDAEIAVSTERPRVQLFDLEPGRMF